MKTSYGVTWRGSDGEPRPARLTVEPTSVVLATIDPTARHEIPIDQIVAVELSRPEAGGRSTLVLTSVGGDTFEIETPVDRWIVADLLEHLFARGLGEAPKRQRILVAVELKPGVGETARELLQGGPPFDPGETALTLHEVFLLGDEALFLFETGADTAIESLVEPDFWQAAGTWADLIAGVRLARPVYSWARVEETPPFGPGPGLGF